MKVCCHCKLSKDLNEFCKNKTKKDGRSSRCKLCDRIYNLEYYRNPTKEQKIKRNQNVKRRRSNILTQIQSLKASYGCQLCPEKLYICLDYHHLSDKSYTISKITNCNKKMICDEINKCVVICRNCHAKVHAGLAAVDPTKKCNVDWDQSKKDFVIK